MASLATMDNPYMDDSQNFDDVILGNLSVIEFNRDSKMIWNKGSREYLKELADPLIKPPDGLTKDVAIQVNDKIKQIIPVFIPIWIATYEYNGNSYYIMADGMSCDKIEGSKPKNKEIMALKEIINVGPPAAPVGLIRSALLLWVVVSFLFYSEVESFWASAFFLILGIIGLLMLMASIVSMKSKKTIEKMKKKVADIESRQRDNFKKQLDKNNGMTL